MPWGAGEIGRLVFFVPRGYRVDLGRPPGAVVGVAVAWSDWGWGDMGRVTADAPEAHIANSCAPGLHDAVWLLRLGVDEREQAVPLFVDRTRGLEGSYRLETCLPRSSELGLRVAMLEIDVDPLTNPARAGAYTWRAFVTPRGADGPDESRAFELRSTVPLPMRLTLRARYDRRSRHAVLTGRFVSSGFDVSGMPVELFVKVGRYFEPLRWTRTGPGGRYSFRRKLRGKATFRAATGAIADCGPSPAPAGCVSESIAKPRWRNSETTRFRTAGPSAMVATSVCFIECLPGRERAWARPTRQRPPARALERRPARTACPG